MRTRYRNVGHRVTSFRLIDRSQGSVSVFSTNLIADFEISGRYPIPICMQKRVCGGDLKGVVLVKCQFPNVIGNVSKGSSYRRKDKTWRQIFFFGYFSRDIMFDRGHFKYTGDALFRYI